MANVKAKAKTNATTNKANNRKEETTMKKANEFEMIMNAINGIGEKVSYLETEIATLKEADAKGKAKNTTTKKAATETKATKGTGKAKANQTNKATSKGTKKTTATKSAMSKGKKSTKKSAPATRTEAIELWCEEKGYTTEDRLAYGEAIREITAEMRAENAEMVTVDKKGNKTYDENYYVGKKWKTEFNKRLEERGFGKRYK